MVLEPLGQHGRVDPATVGLPAAERRHPLLTLARGRVRRRVVRNERQRDVPVHRGEQCRRCRVIGVQDRPQLCLHALLGLEQPVLVAGQRPQLRPPARPPAAPASGRDHGAACRPGRRRRRRRPCCWRRDTAPERGRRCAGSPRTRGDHESADARPAALRTFQAHRQAAAEPGELGVELLQSGDVVAETDLPQPLSGVTDGAQLMVTAAPVDADEDLVRGSRRCRVCCPAGA